MSQEKIKYKRPVEEKTGGVYSCDKIQLVYRLRFGEGQELLDQMARQGWFEYDHWESRKFGTYRNQFSVKCGADGKLSYWLGVGMVAYGKSRPSDTAKLEFNPNKVGGERSLLWLLRQLWSRAKLREGCEVKQWDLAHHLRTQLEYVNEQQLKITDYESYIENWVHEIKKPLSLMTLLLDNRKDEMSPLVHTRMLYVRDHTRQNVEQILYFSRLGAVHKDYYFEPLPILETCKEAVEDNLSLLEEAHFSVTYSGNNCTAISDKKGFMFILGQIISNSVKYAAHDATPAIHFSVSDNKEIGQIVLSICDNGTGIPASDLPFVFDKGFTGDVGSYLSRSTGMGLYLVQQMASDLTIKIDIHSNTNGGTTVILTFPKVERPLGR